MLRVRFPEMLLGNVAKDPDLTEKCDSHKKPGAIGDAVFVDARHVDSEAVFEAATDHQA